MDFRASLYGNEVSRILSFDPGDSEGPGLRPMPLAPRGCTSAEARDAIKQCLAADPELATLFPNALSRRGALAGLYLYFSCLEEAHAVAQDLNTPEGAFWHGIMHRQEGDSANALFWFKQLSQHPVFPLLRDEAHRNRFDTGQKWDPFEFIEFCEASRLRPGSEEERIAMQVQLCEWQLLFDYCANPGAAPL